MSNIKVPDSISKLLKITMRAFYSDLHIILIDVLLRMRYASEYTIAKELNIKIEKIRIITNNLLKEKYLKMEDRLFKRLKLDFKHNKQNFIRRVYKLRYWYIDYNSTMINIKEKIRKIFSNIKIKSLPFENFFLMCPRKICGKKYLMSDIPSLQFNPLSGNFSCSQFLNFKVICGAELIEEKIKDEFKTNKANNNKKIQITLLTPLIELIFISTRNLNLKF
jgi:transcription initiation factor IIE alpha subunit